MRYGHSWSKVCSPILDDSNVYFGKVDFDVTLDFTLYLEGKPDLANEENTLRLQRLLVGEAKQHVKYSGDGFTLMDNEFWSLKHDPVCFSRVPPAVDLGYSYPEYVFCMRCVFGNSIDFRRRNAGAIVGLNMFAFLYALGNVFIDAIAANRPFLGAVENLIAEAWPGTALALPELYITPFARGAER